MIYLLSVSIVLLFILTIIALWRSGFKHWSLWIIIPFLIFNLGFAWHSISSLLGYPYNGLPPSEHRLLHYIIAKPDIYILAQENNKEPRLYVFDYDPETAKKLTAAARDMDAGQNVVIKQQNKFNNESSLEFYNFQLQEHYPKN